ncbi:MAG: RIP metalloprotease RseP [Parvibaculaceae bacterium]
MEIAIGLMDSITSFISSNAIPFLAVLTVIVFFHELGHFLVARWCGVAVEVFSIGFGREIVGWTDRQGTRWKIGWLPLGGYVKFLGDANAASMPDTSAPARARGTGDFHSKPLSRRAAIVAAGPIANFLLAIVIFAASYSLIGVPVSLPVVDEVKAGSAAEAAGMKPGDLIKRIDGKEIASFTDIQRQVADRPGDPLPIVIERNGAEMTLTVTPIATEVSDGAGGKMRLGLLGISRDVRRDLRYDKKGVGEAVTLAVGETWFVITKSLSYVKGVIVGRESADQLAGPLRIAQVSGQAAAVGFSALLQLAAVLSVSIGLINLFPIPLLDGGHLLYYAIEWIRGRPLGPAAQEFGFRIGMVLVLMLMLVATWNDIMRSGS